MRLALIAAFVLLVSGSLALLSPSRAAADARDEAKVHFAKGKQHLDAKEYDQAIVEYQAAYDLVPIPELLFNIGQAYRLKGDKMRAYDAYQKYLDVEPKGRGSAEAKKHMKALKKGAEAQRKEEAEEDARKAEEERKAKEEEARKAEELRKRAEAETDEPMPISHAEDEGPAKEVDKPLPRKQGRAGGGLRVGGLITGGLGLALVGAGVYFGMHAADLQAQGEDLLADGRWHPEVNQIIEDGNTAERNMIICTIAGGAAIVTGGVMYYLGRRAGERSTSVAVAPTHGGAAISLGGSW